MSKSFSESYKNAGVDITAIIKGAGEAYIASMKAW